MLALELPIDLRNKLTPYLGLKGKKARAFLTENPLIITRSEAYILDLAVRHRFVYLVAREYDNDPRNENKVTFASLPSAQQTIIMSVAYQYGENLKQEDPPVAPKFWNHVIRQDWEGAIKELRNFGDLHSTRRRDEADYLEAALQEQTNTTS